MQHIVIGSAVRVLDDIAKVHEYQVGHGGWNDDMALVNSPHFTFITAAAAFNHESN